MKTKEYPFLDFHSHSLSTESNVITVLSVDLNSIVSEETTSSLFCAGAHPWFLPEIYEESYQEKNDDPLLDKLSKLSNKPHFLAIGEIGLDRIRGPQIEVQYHLLELQVSLAMQINSPAIIIHCVRAFDLMLRFLKTTPFQGAIVFHDYRGNKQITEKLLQNPQVFFSLGSTLMKGQIPSFYSLIPLDRIFLETDDEDYPISAVYSHFSKFSNLPLEELRKKILNNFIKLFPNKEINAYSNTQL